ncbi:hypothetical protein JL2886_03122 [Phaeobacter gallaeciensis]|uniref:Uncharacterized protein n=1 Tax=Phaeobacter gallaeciensis TaxID=60890 RepID=A0A1B0ZV83_9RHOB|nr:hypothetical protein JL2886_03122 [Phaeobacter gallaeciensis]
MIRQKAVFFPKSPARAASGQFSCINRPDGQYISQINPARHAASDPAPFPGRTKLARAT